MEEYEQYEKPLKVELFNDHFQNYKRYGIPKAQLVIADIPYNIGENAYASSPQWWENGERTNGESDKAKSNFFKTDEDFRIAEFMHFCSHMLIKEPKSTGGTKKPPCMIVFCAFLSIKIFETPALYNFFLMYLRILASSATNSP